MYHDKQTSHSSQVLISYFHLSRKLKTLNHVSRNNHFTPLFWYWIDLLSKGQGSNHIKPVKFDFFAKDQLHYSVINNFVVV